MHIDAQERARAVHCFRLIASLLTEKAEATTHDRALLTQHAHTMTDLAHTLENGATPPPAVVRLWHMMFTSSLALLDVRGKL